MNHTPPPMKHNHHPDPAHRYGCHNKPDTAARSDRWLDIGCGHSYRVTDPACTDCKWRHG